MERWARVVAVMGLLSLICMDMDARRPVFRNSTWTHVGKSFVADVGTMTETYRLEFGPGQEVVLRTTWVMPSHPATYMNPDGTVDMLPGSRSEYSENGRWRYRLGTLTVTLEDGSRKEYRYKGGTLSLAEPDGTVKEFHRL